MKVRDMVKRAAECLGREDLICAADDVADAPAGELAALMRCYNLVENEIALDYFPLRREEAFAPNGDRVLFSAFSEAPVRIHRVTAAGVPVRYVCDDEGITLSRPHDEVRVLYSYSPAEKGWEDDIALHGRISPRLIAFGMAAEFCTACGMYSEAAMWDKKYRDALLSANVVRRRLAMRPRRWR